MTPWLGVGVARITIAPPKAPARGTGLDEPKPDDGLADLELERELLLQVDLYHGKELATTRKVPVRIGGTLKE